LLRGGELVEVEAVLHLGAVVQTGYYSLLLAKPLGLRAEGQHDGERSPTEMQEAAVPSEGNQQNRADC
jgi:hypothetical protein